MDGWMRACMYMNCVYVYIYIPLFDSSKKPRKVAVPVPSDEPLASRPVRTQRWHGVVEESTGRGNGVGKDHIPVPVTVCIFPSIHIYI